MNTLTKITIALTLFTISNVQLSAQNRNTKTIEGSGNVITKTVTTKAYDIINVRGSMEVTLEIGKEGIIQVTAEDNVQEHILMESDGTTLTISMKNNTSLRNTKQIKIKVPFESLSELSMIGSGEFEGKDLIKSDVLKLSVKGSGEIDIKVETNSIIAELNGSGEIELSGTTKQVSAKTTGSGKFNGEELIADQAEIDISGSGNSSIFVKNSLTGQIKGSGGILYGGNPSTNAVKVFGSGKVKSI